jgi:hypothetical protein
MASNAQDHMQPLRQESKKDEDFEEERESAGLQHQARRDNL